YVRDYVRPAADVILVSMREHEGFHLAPFLFQPRQIRNDQIDTELVGVGKHDTSVDDDRGVAPRDRHHVHAELSEAAERDDLERARRDGRSGLNHSEPSKRTAVSPRK